jgi:nitrous oxide reductase accessory protein NosL
MKKLTPFLMIGFIVVVIVGVFLSLASKQNMIVVQAGNLKQLPLKMELNKHQDSDCGMVIETLEFASQVVAPDGKTWFFHDHGGFVHWLKDKSFKDSAKIWVMSLDTKRWIDGRKAYYSRDDITPMQYGFGAYEKKDARAGLISFDEMKLHMLRGEDMNNPLIRKQLLGE